MNSTLNASRYQWRKMNKQTEAKDKNKQHLFIGQLASNEQNISIAPSELETQCNPYQNLS